MRIFEEFFDDIDIEIEEQAPEQEYYNVIEMRFQNVFRDNNFYNNFCKLVGFLENNVCIGDFKLTLKNKSKFFEKGIDEVLSVCSISDIPRDIDTSEFRCLYYTLEYNTSHNHISFIAMLRFFSNLLINANKCDGIVQYDNSECKFPGCIMTLNGKEIFSRSSTLRSGNYEMLYDNFASFIELWDEFTGKSNEISEKDVIKFCKFMNLRNIYGCLLSMVFCNDTTQPDLKIVAFSINHTAGQYSAKRVITTEETNIDHVKWTECFNEMYFGDKFESEVMKSHPKHYFINLNISMKNKPASVYMSGYPTQEKYEKRENCVLLEYMSVPLIIDGLNSKEVQTVAQRLDIGNKESPMIIQDLNIRGSVTFPDRYAVISTDRNEIKKLGWNLGEPKNDYEIIRKDGKVCIRKNKR